VVEPHVNSETEKVSTAAPTWDVVAVGASSGRWTGRGSVVALFGTGIDAEHPAFRGTTLVQMDFTGTGNGDRNGHSTHAAGTIFGRDVASKRFGVAPGVTEVLVAKVLDDQGRGDDKTIVAALEWVLSMRQVDVICMPIAFDFPGGIAGSIERGMNMTTAIADSLRRYVQIMRVYERFVVAATAIGKGAVIVTPAGNESDPNARAAVTSPLSVAQGVISVGAAKKELERYSVAGFSNTYPSLCAPGVGILSAYPGGELGEKSGTSMACASAAGVAALWWEHLRARTPRAEVTSQLVIEHILKSARNDVFVDEAQDVEFGAGLIQAPQ
jgi:subtilisin family serine protease